MSKGLGINKDLEPLVREVRKRGGTVTVTGSTHVKWVLPCGTVHHTGLTMNDNVAKDHERKIRALLDPVSKVYGVEPAGRGKFHVVNQVTREPVTNGGGFPRTFSNEGSAHAEARRLNCVT